MNRKKSREEAMKLLFEMTINKYTTEEVIENLKENIEEEFESLDEQYIRRVLNGVIENTVLLDEKIERFLINWKMNRISKVNLAIMRICTYEMIFEKDIPHNVSINEAIELTKKYSDEKSAAFVNGVLDKISGSINNN